MKIISVFNNKGGVGKTTLAFHLANIMCDMGKKVLLIDADPQCNITIYSVSEELVQSIWEEEDGIIDAGITNDKNNVPDDILKKPRSIHFLLQPIIDGVDNYSSMPPPHSIRKNLSIIPGRLSLYMFEDTVSKRWSDLYRGDPLAIRTVTAIRNLAEQYGKKYKFDYIIIDTSPSLGVFNKTIISLADGFFIPAQPDIFSLYGIKNIGKSLSQWQNEFHIIYNLLGDEKRRRFPTNFVQFLGYNIYNAKKYTKSIMHKKYNLATAHENYANKIPEYIKSYVNKEVRKRLSDSEIAEPIGGDSIMYTHNTFPAFSQKYHTPMWKVPAIGFIEEEDRNSVNGSKTGLLDTKKSYELFANELILRINKVTNNGQ